MNVSQLWMYLNGTRVYGRHLCPFPPPPPAPEKPPFIFDFTLLQWIIIGSIAGFGLCCAGCLTYFKKTAKTIQRNMVGGAGEGGLIT